MTIAKPMFPPAAGRCRASIPRQKALRRLARLRKEAFAEIDRLIAFLDASDPYVTTEVEEDFEREPGTAEPALGSCDGQKDQTLWSAGCADDCELDAAESGIGDRDGLLEQVGTQDWQHGAMA